MLTDEERNYMMDYDGKHMSNIHVHVYNTEVEVADEHQHILLGVSGPADRVGTSHVHAIRMRTSYSNGHWHWVDIMTDRALAMPDGTHIHYFAGRTSMDDGHCHNFSDVTNLTPDLFMEEDDDEDDDFLPPPPPPKQCKYKYKRPDEEEFN